MNIRRRERAQEGNRKAWHGRLGNPPPDEHKALPNGIPSHVSYSAKLLGQVKHCHFRPYVLSILLPSVAGTAFISSSSPTASPFPTSELKAFPTSLKN